MRKKKWKKVVLIIAISLGAIVVAALAFAWIEGIVMDNQEKKRNHFEGSFDTVWQEYTDHGISYVLDIEARYPGLYRKQNEHTVIPQEFFDKATAAIQQQSDVQHKLLIATIASAAVEPLAEQNYGGYTNKLSEMLRYEIFRGMRADEYFALFEWDKDNHNSRCFQLCISAMDWPYFILSGIYDQLDAASELLFRCQFYDLTKEAFTLSPIAVPDGQAKPFSLSVEAAPVMRGKKVLICRSAYGFKDERDHLSGWHIYDKDMCALPEAQRAYSMEQADYVLLLQTSYQEGFKYDSGMPSYTAFSTAYILDTKTNTCIYTDEIFATAPAIISYEFGEAIREDSYPGAGKLSIEDLNKQFNSVMALLKAP